MKDSVEHDFHTPLDTVFARLDPQEVEEFYSAYQQWTVQRRVARLKQRIDEVRQQQLENEQRIQQVQPSPIALAALARLQSNGVSDTKLLDTLLERGETWLDQTMQRLNYCEQFTDFISADYTQWCRRALEDAFDWIDSLPDAPEQKPPADFVAPDEATSPANEDAGEVEAMFLQKLATEDEDLSWQETTLKQNAIKLPGKENAGVMTRPSRSTQPLTPEMLQSDQPVDQQTEKGEQPSMVELPPTVEPAEAVPTSDFDSQQPAFVEFAPAAESVTVENEPGDTLEQPVLVEPVAQESIPQQELVPQELSPQKEPSTGNVKSDEKSERPARLKFSAPLELSPAEEAADQVLQQTAPAEIATPEDTPAVENTTQNEVTDPSQHKISASSDVALHTQRPEGIDEAETTRTNRTHFVPREVPRKRSWLQRLIGALLGQ